MRVHLSGTAFFASAVFLFDIFSRDVFVRYFFAEYFCSDNCLQWWCMPGTRYYTRGSPYIYSSDESLGTVIVRRVVYWYYTSSIAVVETPVAFL